MEGPGCHPRSMYYLVIKHGNGKSRGRERERERKKDRQTERKKESKKARKQRKKERKKRKKERKKEGRKERKNEVLPLYKTSSYTGIPHCHAWFTVGYLASQDAAEAVVELVQTQLEAQTQGVNCGTSHFFNQHCLSLLLSSVFWKLVFSSIPCPKFLLKFSILFVFLRPPFFQTNIFQQSTRLGNAFGENNSTQIPSGKLT